MPTVNELRQKYLDRYQEYQQENTEINARIEALLTQIATLQEEIDQHKAHKRLEFHVTFPDWIDELVKPIGDAIANRFQAEYEVYGPFGLNCRVGISLKKEGEVIAHLSLRPGDLLKKAELFYETGSVSNEYPSGSIGALNGENLEILPLPDDFDAIFRIVDEQIQNRV